MKVHRVNAGYDLYVRLRCYDIRYDLSHMAAAAM
jgi:hypothetical protein